VDFGSLGASGPRRGAPPPSLRASCLRRRLIITESGENVAKTPVDALAASMCSTAARQAVLVQGRPDRQRCGVQVTNQLGVLPRHEVQVPPGEVNEESEVNARCAPPALLPRL
jgi:hypothetical protein